MRPATCIRNTSILLASALVVSILSQSSMAAVTLIGSNISIGSSAFWSAGGYNATSDEYLALWVDVADANGWQLKGQRINPNTGALIGSVFYVSNSPSTVSAIIGSVTYNSTNGEWFVVYQSSISGGADDVLGQRIASNGTKVGGYISLVVKSGYQNGAEVAYDSTNNRYLVVWREVVGGNGQIFSRIFDATGSPVTSELRLSEVDNRQKYTSKVAYNPVAGEYMAIWQDYRNYPGSGQDNDYSDIYGQRVDPSTGAKIGANIPVYAPVGPPYNPNGQDTPNGIACNTQDGRYAVGFTKLTAAEGYTTSGLIINSNGTQTAPAFNLSRPNFGAQATPAYNPVSNTYVFSYEGPSSNVGCREISPAGVVLTAEESIVTGMSVRDNILVIRPSDGRYLQLFSSDSTGLIAGQRFTTSIPPEPVTNFVATSANQQITLSWTNPGSSSFTGTMIRFSTSGFPATATSGTLLVDKSNTPGSNDSTVHAGLSNGILYYYTAFSHNSTPIYALGKNAVAAPTAPLCFSDSFTYSDGNLNGKGGWSGSATTQIQVVSQAVRITGGANAYDAIKTLTCGDPGTRFIKVTIKVKKETGGSSTMWSVYMDDPAGLNFGRWYGTGSSATGRIASSAIVTAGQTLTGGWDELIAKINPYARTTEFFFNGASIGTLDYSSTGAGNTLGRVWFDRIDNSGAAGNTISFDDLMVGYATLQLSPGDFDGDGDVDSSDFGHLQNCFSDVSGSIDAGCQNADLNEDNSVNDLDFDLFLNCLAGANNPPGC